MIKRILAALDASARAPSVLWTAGELARRFQAKVFPLRVIFVPPEFPPAAHVDTDDLLPARMIEQGEEALRQLVAFTTNVELAPPIVRHGQPWRVILAVADEIDADLIVLGSHGYHGLDRILGTTAGKVANLSRRDVYVVHNRIEPPNSEALLSGEDGPYR